MRGEPDLLFLYGETWDGNKAEEFRKGGRRKNQKMCVMWVSSYES